MFQASAYAITTHVIATRDHNFNDKWLRILPQDAPFIPSLKDSYLGEKIYILVFVADYAIDKSKEANISYDIDIINPNGKEYYSKKDNQISKGKVVPNNVLLAQRLTVMRFELSDEPGKYTFKINVKDKVKNTNIRKEIHVNVQKNVLTKDAGHGKKIFREFFMNYYQNLKVEYFLSYFDNYLSTISSLDKQNQLSSLYFFHQLLKANPFLLEDMKPFLSRHDKTSQKYIFKIMKTLPHKIIKKEFLEHIKSTPLFHDPYTDGISKGFHLDMLWSDFFATGSFKSIMSLVSAMESNISAKTLLKKAIAEAAKWSLESNSRQSKLACQYMRFINHHKKKMKLKYSAKTLEKVAKSCMKNFKQR